MTLFGIFTITSLLWNLLSYRAGSNTGQAALHQHRRFAQPRWSAQRPLPYWLDYLRLRALLVRLCETPEALSEYSLTCSAKCIRSQAPSVTFYLKHKGEVWRAQQTSSPFRPFNRAKCACGQIFLKTGFSPFLWMRKTVEVKMINIQSVQCVRDWTLWIFIILTSTVLRIQRNGLKPVFRNIWPHAHFARLNGLNGLEVCWARQTSPLCLR